MLISALNRASPLVRNVRVMQSMNLSGNWIDYDYVVTLIVRGEAVFYIGNDKKVAKKGDVVIMPPMHPHMVVSVGEETLVQYIFHFDFFYTEERVGVYGLFYDDVMARCPPSKKEKAVLTQPHMVHLDHDKFAEVQTLFLKMHSCFINQKPYSDLSLKHLCLEFILLCINDGEKLAIESANVSSKSYLHVQQAIEYIIRNYDNPELNNNVIAQQLNVTPKYLSYLFVKVLGVQIHTYISHTRIEAAKKLMLLGRFNLTEIAYSTGYSGIHSFSKAFKRETMFSPSEYLKEYISTPEILYLKR